jgi:hypothetical protein
MQRMENAPEEHNGKDAAHGRRLEKLRRDFGPTFLAALNDPQTIESMPTARCGRKSWAVKWNRLVT